MSPIAQHNVRYGMYILFTIQRFVSCRQQWHQILSTRSKRCITLAERTKCCFCERGFWLCLPSASTWVCNKADSSEKTFSDMCFRKVSVHGASKETAAWKKYKMKASGVAVIVRCFVLNLQQSACLVFVFVWCLLRWSNIFLIWIKRMNADWQEEVEYVPLFLRIKGF